MTAQLFRIIDANFNRAREALRVMEEYARFVLDDRPATETLKSLRHRLTEIVGGLVPAEKLLAARDTDADVGTELSGSTERSRPHTRAVFSTAAGRLAESLRALEEYAKVIDPAAAAQLETCRYRSYELDKKLSFLGDRHRRISRARLYVLVTASLCRREWLTTIKEVARAGAQVIQLREKDLQDRELLRRACRAAEVCHLYDTLFILNDRPDIAHLCRADGVHLGQDDLEVSAARRILGPDLLVGLSTHSPEQLDEALEQQPDYLSVGPMFSSTTKPRGHVPGPQLLALALEKTELPVVAVGGINADNLHRLRPARACCVAVCSAVIAQPSPADSVGRLLNLLATTPTL